MNKYNTHSDLAKESLELLKEGKHYKRFIEKMDNFSIETYEFLEFLGAPEAIMTKAPSAALFEGQTDEQEMGITYKEIDNYILTGEATPEGLAIIRRYHDTSEHKRRPLRIYGNE